MDIFAHSLWTNALARKGGEALKKKGKPPVNVATFADLESKKNFFFSMGLIVLCIGLLDHYWLTLEPALFLAALLFSSISRFLSDPIPIKAIKKAKKLKPILESPK